jgi:enoyl-CoA hydratase
MSSTYEMIRLERRDQVATITLGRIDQDDAPPPMSRGVHMPAEVADVINDLRGDQNSRVIVFTGRENVFLYPPTKFPWHGHPGRDWEVMTSMGRALENLIGSEKVTISKLNGPALGFGATLTLACDFIVASDEAAIAYHHLSMGELELQGAIRGRHPSGTGKACGDGGMVFMPLHLPLNLAKKAMMLGEPLSAKELHAHGLIYAAGPRKQLDAATDNLVERLLKRHAYGLAWTKRVLNQRLRDSFNMAFDAGIAYEFLSNYMQMDHPKERGEGRGIGRL